MADKGGTILRKLFLLACSVLLGAVGLNLSLPLHAAAADLTQRSLHITSPSPGESTRHTFTFSYASTATPVGSVVFEYCQSPLPAIACVAPVGLDASGALMAGQTGEADFSLFQASAGRIVIARTPAAMPLSNPSQYMFDNVINPTGSLRSFYARITTHASTDGSGAPIDFGAVVNSTTQGLGLNTEVPPILNFCVGVSIPGDCSTAEGSLIDLGDLSPKLTASGSSQMMVGTNADFGVSIAAYGTTMTSGNNTIPALATPTASAPGNSQFGLNLRDNASPPIGLEPSGPGAANPTSNYGNPDRFAFISGDIVASHPDVTDMRKFTVSYIVNVSPNQTPGVYTATLTYICTASF